MIEKVRIALINAGFVESVHESTGFELYESANHDEVVLLSVLHGDTTERARHSQLKLYKQALVQQFEVELSFPVIKVKERVVGITHSLYCIQREKEDKAWVEQWPNYCFACKGYGQFSDSYDPSPAGLSLSAGYMTNVDPCEDCTVQGLCPRCGQPGLTNEEQGRGTDTGTGPCTICGWNYKDGGRPEGTCYCESEDSNEYE